MAPAGQPEGAAWPGIPVVLWSFKIILYNGIRCQEHEHCLKVSAASVVTG